MLLDGQKIGTNAIGLNDVPLLDNTAYELHQGMCIIEARAPVSLAALRLITWLLQIDDENRLREPPAGGSANITEKHLPLRPKENSLS